MSLLLPGTREKLQGGILEVFNLFFGQFSVYFRTNFRGKIRKNPFKRPLKPFKSLLKGQINQSVVCVFFRVGGCLTFLRGQAPRGARLCLPFLCPIVPLNPFQNNLKPMRSPLKVFFISPCPATPYKARQRTYKFEQIFGQDFDQGFGGGEKQP